LIGIPISVWCGDLSLPVFLDKVLKFLSVSGGWIWNGMVRKPSLELVFVPLIIYWGMLLAKSLCIIKAERGGYDA